MSRRHARAERRKRHSKSPPTVHRPTATDNQQPALGVKTEEHWHSSSIYKVEKSTVDGLSVSPQRWWAVRLLVVLLLLVGLLLLLVVLLLVVLTLNDDGAKPAGCNCSS